MPDCDRIDEARDLLSMIQTQLDVFRASATNEFWAPISDAIIKSAEVYLSKLEAEINQLEKNCEFVKNGKIDCDALYLARIAVSEGDVSGSTNENLMLYMQNTSQSTTAMAALIIQQVNRRASGLKDFYNFSVVADHLRPLYTDVTQTGEAENTLSAYEGYMRYCQEDNPEGALSGVWNADIRFSDALVISRAILWGQEGYGDPLAAFGKHADEYWNQVYPLYSEYEEIEIYRDYNAVLERLGLNLEQLEYVKEHPELIQEVSFDASVFEVLDRWKELALAELERKYECDIQVTDPETGDTIGLCDFIRDNGYFPMDLTQGGQIPYGSTYTKLLPVANASPPMYLRGANTGVLLYDDVPGSPIHTAWQCEQNPEDVDRFNRPRVYYRVGHRQGPCRKCDPEKARFSDGYVIAKSCCDGDPGNVENNDCYCRGEVSEYFEPCE